MTTQVDIILRILDNSDNLEPITAEWLQSIEVHNDGEKGVEHTATLQVIDSRTNAVVESSYGEEWEVVVCLGYNVETGECFIEEYGGNRAFSTDTQEVIIFQNVKTRLQFRLLLAAHGAWGYRGT